ncbi:MAG: KEOPS complex subunit Pcc1 [Methanoculleus sp.]
MTHRATFRFITDDARALYLSVYQEMDDAGERSSVLVRFAGDDMLILEVAATDMSALRAALNTWLRLINIALEVRETVISPAPSG